MPVVHFPTNPNGDDYGTSELEAIIPLQRVLTSLWVDLIAAADELAGIRERTGRAAPDVIT